MVEGVDHIEMLTHDAGEMVDFLELLGLELTRETDHHGSSFEMRAGDSERPIIEIHTVEMEENPGVNHIALRVDDIEALTEQLEANGVQDIHGPVYVEETNRKITNFRDPDGRRLQLVESVEED